jgi:uncharacterized membrane protein
MAEHDVPFSLERVVFFSDAVFAIAITLLALEIRLPDASDGSAASILGLGPVFFAFALSFWAIGQYWLAHWRRYDFLVRADQPLAATNLVHLAFITLIPFTTSLLADHGDEAGPVVVYALVVSAAGVFGTGSWLYAHRAGLIDAAVPWPYVRLTALRGFAVPIVFTAALPLLLVHPFAAEAVWLLVFPLQYLIVRRLRRHSFPTVRSPSATT